MWESMMTALEEREEETQRTNERGCTSQLENTSEPMKHAAVNVCGGGTTGEFFFNKKAPLDKGTFRLYLNARRVKRSERRLLIRTMS